MGAGRSRLEIGTYGDISTTRTPAGTSRAVARFRDWDGEVRKVTAVGSTAAAVRVALPQKLARRSSVTGFGVTLSSKSIVAELAAVWLVDVRPLRAPILHPQRHPAVDNIVRSITISLHYCHDDEAVGSG